MIDLEPITTPTDAIEHLFDLVERDQRFNVRDEHDRNALEILSRVQSNRRSPRNIELKRQANEALASLLTFDLIAPHIPCLRACKELGITRIIMRNQPELKIFDIR